MKNYMFFCDDQTNDIDIQNKIIIIKKNYNRSVIAYTWYPYFSTELFFLKKIK